MELLDHMIKCTFNFKLLQFLCKQNFFFFSKVDITGVEFLDHMIMFNFKVL